MTAPILDLDYRSFTLAGVVHAVENDKPVVVMGKRYIRDPEDIPPVIYSDAEAKAMRKALKRLERIEGRS